MPLEITKRLAQIGPSINTRTQKHGDDDVAAFDIPIIGVPLDNTELGELLLKPEAYGTLYDFTSLKMPVPRFAALGALPLAHKIEGASVALYLGRRVMKLTGISLSKNRILLQSGGTSAWNFVVQCTPDIDEMIDSLFSKLNQQIQIEVYCEGYGAQQDLPLDRPAEDEQIGADLEPREDDDADPVSERPSRMERNIRRAAKKKQARAAADE